MRKQRDTLWKEINKNEEAAQAAMSIARGKAVGRAELLEIRGQREILNEERAVRHEQREVAEEQREVRREQRELAEEISKVENSKKWVQREKIEALQQEKEKEEEEE